MRKEWRSEPLGSVCEMINRGVAPTYVSEGGLRVVNQKCVRNHVIDYGLARRHDARAKAVPADRLIRLGDVLVNSTGTGTLGRVAQVRSEPNEATTVDTHVTIVRPKVGLFHLDFFGYAMRAIENEIAASGEGTSGQTELARSTLQDDFTVTFPESIAEQQRIVATLDEAFEGAGLAIANAEQSLERATTLFELTRRALFFAQEREWGTKPIASICENLDGRRRPVTKHDRESGDVPYYGASGVVDHVRDHLFDEDLLLVSEDGANLLMRTYPIAFSIAGPAWVNNHAHVLRFPNRSTQSFVEHYLNSIDLKPYVSGMAQPKLNQGALNAIEVPMPPLDVQKAIVAKLAALQAETSSLSSIYTRKLASLADLKQSLLNYAFSGELAREEPAAANDNFFAKPEQVANVLAVLHVRHEQIGRDKTFGRVKAQKGLHLMESVGRVELGRTPWKDLAGPNDFPHMLTAEGLAKAQGFFEFVPRSDGGYGFVKLQNYVAMIRVARDAIRPIDDAVQKVTDLIGVLDSREAEVVATVHAAWNNLILDGIEPTDDAIIREARDEWHPKKLRIPEAMFRDAIRLIRRKGIVPDGSAKRVAHREPKLL